MDNSQPDPASEGPWHDSDSSDVIFLEIDGSGESVRRPMTAEEIAAVKRYYERMGRKPPPPYDKL